MRKLLLIVLIILLIGAVSAHEDLNTTVLGDTQYNGEIDDDDEMLVVEQDDSIPVHVTADENWSLNVYIDRQDSVINGEFNNVSYSQFDLPTSVMADDDESSLALGKHNIVYEFRFTNTTSIYKPDAAVSGSSVYFDFNFVRTLKNPTNSVYRFTSQFNIINGSAPITTTLHVDDVNITQSDALSFALKGLSNANVNIYLDGDLYDSFETDESPFEDEIDTTRLKVGSYDLVCVIESEKVRSEYNITADNSDSMVNVKFTRTKITTSSNRYIATIKATLNVCEIPELNTITITAPSVDITRTRSVPIYFEGENVLADLTAYIDGKKVYNNTVLLSWENPVYIPTRDTEGNYFNEGSHDLSFEFVFQDKYEKYSPTVTKNKNSLTFNFLGSKSTNVYLNDKYVINSKLNILDSDNNIIPIDCSDNVKITHTEDIHLKISGLPSYNLTVFVDDVEIHDVQTSDDEIAIKTFLPRSSIEETNERDIQTGTHKIRFEFKTLLVCSGEAEYKSGSLNFDFTMTGSDVRPEGVSYQLNTSLIVTEKQKTVHILKVKNNTYFDDTEFVVKMDLYVPETDDDDWDDDDVENPLGTQDVGIIVSDDKGVCYMGDYLMNVYESMQFNYDFENELLPRAGTYTMKIINLADNTYDTMKFQVKKANRVFNRKYTTDDFNVLFTLDFSSCRDDLKENCHVTLDNQEKIINTKKALSSSKKEVLFTDIDPGTYTARFTLEGNEIYNEVTLKLKVTVKKEAPEISYRKNGAKTIEVSVDIPKSKTTGIVIVTAGGVEKKYTVSKNTGKFTVEFDSLSSGDYEVEISFMGNERYTKKTVTGDIGIDEYSKPGPEPAVPEPADEEETGTGDGNNTGGNGNGNGNTNGTGVGPSNAAGNGNGTYDGKISLNARGSNGDVGSLGSASGGGVKGYEITKKVTKQIEDNNVLLIFLIIALILLFLSFIYERREDEKEEY